MMDRRIRTEAEKAEMLRLREEEKLSNQEIADRFGIEKGDIVRKALARFQKRSVEIHLDHTEAALAEAAPVDGLTRLHDEFDTKIPYRAASRPKWAGRPPLRITPKDFQR